MAKIILEIEADPTGLAPAADAIKQIGKLSDDLYQKLQTANNAYKQMAQTMVQSANLANTAQKNLNKTVDEFSGKLKNSHAIIASGAFIKAATEASKFSATLVTASANINRLSATVANLSTQLNAMQNAGLSATKAFTSMESQLVETKKQLAETQELFDKTADNIQPLEDLKSSIGGLSAAVGIAKDTLSLFNIENKDLELAISKVDSVINIIKCSMDFATTATTAFTAAETALNTAVKGTSLAMNGLRAAIISTGIGALVVTIGYLVNELTRADKAVDNLDESHSKYAITIGNELAQSTLLFEKAKRLNNTRDEQKALINEINTVYKDYLPSLLTEKSTLHDIEAAQRAVNKRLIERISLEARDDELRTKIKSTITDEADRIRTLAEVSGLSESKIRSLIQAKVDLERAMNNTTKPTTGKTEWRLAPDDDTQPFEKIDSSVLDVVEEIAKDRILLEDEVKKIVDSYETIIDPPVETNTGNKVYEKLEDDGNAYYLWRIEQEKKSKALYDKELRIISDFGITAEYVNEEWQKSQIDDYGEFLDDLANRLTYYGQSVKESYLNAIAIQDILDANRAIDTLLQQQFGISLDQIDKLYEEWLKTHKGTYQDFSNDVTNELQKLKDLQKELFGDTEAFKIKDLQTQFDNAKAILDKALADNILSYEDYIKSLDALQRKKKEKEDEILDPNADQRKEAMLQIATETYQAIFDIANQYRQANFDAQFAKLNEEKDLALDNENLTKEQKENIQNQFAEKEKALKRKQFESDKRAKIAEATMNGLAAITKLLVNPGAGSPLYPIALATTIATSALQVAKLMATPTPQFAKGTRNAPPGLKWVGEEGPELINTPGNHAIITAPESAQLAAIFDRYGLPSLQVPMFKASTFSHLLNGQSGGSSFSLDYDEMGRSIARHLPEGAKVNINMDKDGVHAYVARSNSRVNYNNNKFRFN